MSTGMAGTLHTCNYCQRELPTSAWRSMNHVRTDNPCLECKALEDAAGPLPSVRRYRCQGECGETLDERAYGYGPDDEPDRLPICTACQSAALHLYAKAVDDEAAAKREAKRKRAAKAKAEARHAEAVRQMLQARADAGGFAVVAGVADVEPDRQSLVVDELRTLYTDREAISERVADAKRRRRAMLAELNRDMAELRKAARAIDRRVWQIAAQAAGRSTSDPQLSLAI